MTDQELTERFAHQMALKDARIEALERVVAIARRADSYAGSLEGECGNSDVVTMRLALAHLAKFDAKTTEAKP